ncbi:MAG TPA: SDR family oxidoreductase [Steroidobacteraceae bacterium]|jgi:NAD(P)-dependent dehydrogenase (short-subunit alcohol dehydrogenase family)
MKRSLEGKAIVITGAGQGLGRSYALRAADLGACVVVNDLDKANAESVAQAIDSSGGRAIPVVGSVADWDVAEALIQQCVRSFGAIDGLVNNAALHHLELPWDETESQIRSLIEVNVMGTIYCGVHALRAMIGQRRGSIVNVSSSAQFGMELRATYGASKGAAASLTYGWAGEAMPYNVRVNALSPGANTPMMDASKKDELRFSRVENQVLTIPGPDTVAPIVGYLLSDLAQGITGQHFRMAWNEISVVTHPADSPPHEQRESWTEQEIAKAFDETLRAHLKPFAYGRDAYVWNPDAALAVKRTSAYSS